MAITARPFAARLPFATRHFLLILVLGSPLAAGDDKPGGRPGDVTATVKEVVGALAEKEGAQFWTTVSRLEGLGPEAIPALRNELKDAADRSRLGCAKAILALLDGTGEEEGPADKDVRSEALAALEDLARKAKSAPVRAAAVDLFSTFGAREEVQPILQEIFDQTVDPETVITLARNLWKLGRDTAARDRLIKLLGSRDTAVKREAALALAEIDYFEGEVRDIIRTLKDEPSEQGRRARDLDRAQKMSRQLDREFTSGGALLEGVDPVKLLKIKDERIRELERKVERGGAAPARQPQKSDPLLEEIIGQIQRAYVDEAKTDRKRLILNAVRGMVRSLDEFSSFMDVEDTKSFTEHISGSYPGIGATVNKQPGAPLEIVKPIYGGPAYAAGLLSGDLVLEVSGTPTDRLEIGDIVKKLKGPSETKIVLRVFRRGWTEPREFTVERRSVDIPSVYYEMLPGKIGFVQLQQFGDRAVDEFTAAVDALEKEDMAALVLDLRDDPGGFLEAAVKIVDTFVSGGPDKLPIVTQKGRARQQGGKEVELNTYPDPFARPGYPMVVLVNERSASASEIVAGALQDFGRATIVGRRTFGKGSVQRLIPLSEAAQEAIGGEGKLRLTVQYYYLPLGRCIHTLRDEDGRVVEQGGVEPDVAVEAPKIPVWRLEEMERLRGLEVVLDYMQQHFEEVKDLFPEGDGGDPLRYPGFEELYKAAATPAPRDDLRRVLRFHVRRRLEDARGREFACDIQEDAQLQAAILESLKKLGEKPETFPRYAGWAAKQ